MPCLRRVQICVVFLEFQWKHFSCGAVGRHPLHQPPMSQSSIHLHLGLLRYVRRLCGCLCVIPLMLSANKLLPLMRRCQTKRPRSNVHKRERQALLALQDNDDATESC